MTVAELTDKATELGRDYGKSVGSWAIDGNTSREQCLKILTGYDDGDPEIMDMCPSPLSGEFADGPTVHSVLKELGVLWSDERSDDLIDAYEDAFAEGYWDAVLSAAKAHV